MSYVAALAGVLLAASSLNAQWFHITTPETPRLPNGKPDLNGPVARTADGKPDLQGIWQFNGKYLQDIAADLKPEDIPWQPAAKALWESRKNGAGGKDDPAARCLPGMPKLDNLPYPFKIVWTPKMMIMLFEGFTTWRQIFTDGRALPKDPEPFWMGYSVGKWDGDTFVVDTIGINETTWIDNAGRPHSDALHLTERFHRRNYGRLDMEITFDDPKTFTRPWTVKEDARILPDTELLEYVCENNKDYEHIVGSQPGK